MHLGFLSSQNSCWIWTSCILVAAEVQVIWLYMENRDEGKERRVKEASKGAVSSCWGHTVPWRPTGTVVGTRLFLRRHNSETNMFFSSFLINFSLLLNKYQDWHIKALNRVCWTGISHTHYHLCSSICKWPLTVPDAVQTWKRKAVSHCSTATFPSCGY